MLLSNPLDGNWEGYYDHDNKIYSSKNFPISATIVQEGDSFRGIMVDGITDFRHSYRTIVEAFEGQMSPWAEHRARRILEMVPDYTIESSLPEESRLDGKIVGDRIRFIKTYLGTCSHYGNAGDGRVLLGRIDRHRVEYEGTLNAEGRVIEGRWAIRRRFLGRIRRPLATGGFQLVKKE